MLHFVVAAVSLLLLTSIADAHHRPGHGGPSGSSPPSEPLQVYDFFEQRLGQYTSRGCFIRHVEGYWLEICGLDAQGGHEFGQYFLLFSEPDCQGQAYLSTAWEGSLHGDIHSLTFEPVVSVSRRGFIQQEGGPLVFAADPIQWVPVQSWIDPLPGGDCIDLDAGYETLAGEAVFVNIQDWVPPFSIR